MKINERLHYCVDGNMCEKQVIYYGRNLPFEYQKSTCFIKYLSSILTVTKVA